MPHATKINFFKFGKIALILNFDSFLDILFKFGKIALILNFDSFLDIQDNYIWVGYI